jgi:hypothetical protein
MNAAAEGIFRNLGFPWLSLALIGIWHAPGLAFLGFRRERTVKS